MGRRLAPSACDVGSSEFRETRGSAEKGHARWIVLSLGILAVSTGSILVRLADAPALAVGAWRLLLATLLLAPLAWWRGRGEWRSLGRGDWLRVGLAGTALAAHFATWIASLSLTTVASSVVLVSTNPIFVGLATHCVLGERLSKRGAMVIVVALAGTVVIGWGDLSVSGQALLGDALALVGAAAMSTYLLLGRAVRCKISTLAYVWPCYGVAGLALLGMCAVSGQPLWPYSGQTVLVFVGLAIVPQILGHSSLNWALAHVSPVMVTLAILGEPVGATLLAAAVLREAPPLAVYLGAPLILTGIYLASREELSD